MLDVAQQQDRAFELPSRVMERRDGYAYRRLSAPARNEIALAARALLARRLVFLTRSMSHGSRLKICSNSCPAVTADRNFGENFGGFVKERNFPCEIERDDSVVEIRQDLFPGYPPVSASRLMLLRASFHDRN